MTTLYLCEVCLEADTVPWTCYGPQGAGEHRPPIEAVAYVRVETEERAQ